jgi:predicted RNase H-like HicB family nuclease
MKTAPAGSVQGLHHEHDPRLENPHQTIASFDAPTSILVARWRLLGALPSEAMSEPLRLTIVYEDAGDGDGWVVARIPQVRGAISQGRTREEARENVIDALRELLAGAVRITA